jgi:hypothetical protein
MESFKVGDKVMCVYPDSPLAYGVVYTIIELYKGSDEPLCRIKELKPKYFKSRFILATELNKALS